MIEILKNYQAMKDAGLIDHAEVITDTVTSVIYYRIWMKQWNPNDGSAVDPVAYAMAQDQFLAMVDDQLAIVDGAMAFLQDIDPDTAASSLPTVTVSRKTPAVKVKEDPSAT